jgi:hypothetical protein
VVAGADAGGDNADEEFAGLGEPERQFFNDEGEPAVSRTAAR